MRRICVSLKWSLVHTSHRNNNKGRAMPDGLHLQMAIAKVKQSIPMMTRMKIKVMTVIKIEGMIRANSVAIRLMMMRSTII